VISKAARETFAVRRGDILFNRTSETQDEVGLSTVYDDDDAVVFGGFVIRGRFTVDAFDKTYVGYALRAPIVRSQVIAQGQGAIRANIGQANLKRVLVPIPSKLEQRAIAEALSDMDGLLGALEALIAKKRSIKQAAMRQLLTGKTRLPGFNGEWETKRLGKFAAIRNQKVLPAELDPETPCVELEHIGQGDGRLFDCSTARYSSSTKYRFLAGDVLFGRLRPYLRKFWHAEWRGVCTTEIWPLVVDSKQAASGFLRAVVETDRFVDTASVSYGTHMPRADWGVMQNFEVRLPSVEEQTAIASDLSDMDAEIAALEARRDKTRAIKQGMMQQLLTGRVRLVTPTHAEAVA
jgi:type I restriction enzyme S subunit